MVKVRPEEDKNNKSTTQSNNYQRRTVKRNKKGKIYSQSEIKLQGKLYLQVSSMSRNKPSRQTAMLSAIMCQSVTRN